MSVQDTVNSIADRLSAVSDQLSKGFDEVRGKIAELEANSRESVDFSAVNAALDKVAGQAQALDDVVPDAVAEEPVLDEEPVSDDLVPVVEAEVVQEPEETV